jgi:hypothetical protein
MNELRSIPATPIAALREEMVRLRQLDSGTRACRRWALALGSLAFAAGTPGFPSIAGASPGFIENRGQVHEAVRYYQRGSGANVYFTAQAVVLDLAAPAESGAGAAPQGCAVYVRFAQGNPSPRVEARSPLATRYHYFLGGDPARWRAEVPCYAEVVYRDVWPGIDLVFRDQEGSLAYEALVRAGADPGRMAFTYQGVATVRPGAAGVEEIETAAGPLAHERHGSGFPGVPAAVEPQCPGLEHLPGGIQHGPSARPGAG